MAKYLVALWLLSGVAAHVIYTPTSWWQKPATWAVIPIAAIGGPLIFVVCWMEPIQEK